MFSLPKQCPSCGGMGCGSPCEYGTASVSKEKPPTRSDEVQRVVDGRGMIEEYLRKHGYDGLYCDECGCELSDLMPCGGESAIDCMAGYKHDGCTDDCGMGCDFHISPIRY